MAVHSTRVCRHRTTGDRDLAAIEGKPCACDRRFWVLAGGVVLTSIMAMFCDLTLTPAMHNWISIAQPARDLRNWDFADRAWAARRTNGRFLSLSLGIPRTGRLSLTYRRNRLMR